MREILSQRIDIVLVEIFSFVLLHGLCCSTNMMTRPNFWGGRIFFLKIKRLVRKWLNLRCSRMGSNFEIVYKLYCSVPHHLGISRSLTENVFNFFPYFPCFLISTRYLNVNFIFPDCWCPNECLQKNFLLRVVWLILLKS